MPKQNLRLLSVIIGVFLISMMAATGVSAASFATGVALSAYSDCDSPAGLDISMNTDATVNREGGIVTTGAGNTLMSFDQGSGFANFNGTFAGYNFSSPAWSVPAGTVIGLYAYVGSLPYSAATTIEWFVAYECDTQQIVFSCTGSYGTCPQNAATLFQTGGGPGPSCLSTPDGRLNDSPAVDCAAPVVLYRDSGGIDIYGINPSNSQGILLIEIAPSQYEGSPSETTLLEEVVNTASGQPIQVYQLAGGGIQVNAFYRDGKPYSVSWTPSEGLTHLAW